MKALYFLYKLGSPIYGRKWIYYVGLHEIGNLNFFEDQLDRAEVLNLVAYNIMKSQMDEGKKKL